MKPGIDPKVDFAFHLTFGNPAHTRITIHFLNAVLNLPTPITWVEVLNPVQGRKQVDDKLAVLDVLAEDAHGRLYNIEMQTTLPAGMRQRLTFYNCQNFVRQLRPGGQYQQLRPAISICVLNCTLWRDVDAYHLSFRLRVRSGRPDIYRQPAVSHAGTSEVSSAGGGNSAMLAG